jgi:lysophospholipase L1-like esterase
MSRAKANPVVLSVVAMLLGVVIALLLGEVFLRIYQQINPTFVFPDRSYNRFRGKPFADDYDFKLNSKGFKDVEFDARKKPGGIRIIGIGDSFVFGIVPYRFNFLTLLEEHLLGDGLPVEVINMGIPGTSPREYLAVYLHEAFELEADIVLLCLFVGNDFEDSKRPPLIQSYVASLIRYLLVKQKHWKGNVIHGAKDYNDEQPDMTEDKYLGIETQRSHVFRRDNPQFEHTFENTLRYVKQMHDLCRQQQCRLVVVVMPDEMQINNDLQNKVMSQFDTVQSAEWDFSLPNRRLAAELEVLGIPFIDLLDAFKTVPQERRLYRPQDSHWNIAGNRLAAEVLAKHLSSMLCNVGRCGQSGS